MEKIKDMEVNENSIEVKSEEMNETPKHEELDLGNKT